MRKLIATIVILMSVLSAAMAGKYKFENDKYVINPQKSVITKNGNDVVSISDFEELVDRMNARVEELNPKLPNACVQRDKVFIKKYTTTAKDTLWVCLAYAAKQVEVGEITLDEFNAKTPVITNLIETMNKLEAQYK